MDSLEVGLLDIASNLEILRAHADLDRSRLLLLWNLFEGVLKVYRDCFEQQNAPASNARRSCADVFPELRAPLS